MMNARRCRGDEGASLILALVLLTLLSVFVVSALSLGAVSFKNTTVTESRTDQLYAADGGIENAIEKVANEDWCMTADAPAAVTLPQPINGKTVTVTCETTEGGLTTNSGSPLLGQYVAVVLGEGVAVHGPDDDVEEGGWERATFHGNVYSGRPMSVRFGETFVVQTPWGPFPIHCSDWWQFLGTPFPETCAWIDVQGNLDVDQTTCPPDRVDVTGTCTPNASPGDLGILSDPPTVRIPGDPVLPPKHIGNNCWILYPGRYSSLSFLPTRRYYMASGTYYFSGSSDVVLQGQIFGGAPSPEAPWEDTKLIKGPAAPCANDALAQQHSIPQFGQPPRYEAAKAGTGVTLIRGGQGRLRVKDPATKVELYTRVPAPSSVPGRYDAGADPGVTFWAKANLEQGDIVAEGGTYTPSNPVNGEVFVSGDDAKDADVVIHGLSYVPDLRTKLREPFNAEVGNEEGNVSFFLGGVIAKKLTMVRQLEGVYQKVALAGTGEPTQSFVNRTTTVVATAASTSGGAPTTVTAVIRPDEPSGPVIETWRQT